MIKSRRILSLLMSVALVTGVLSGCGNVETKEEASASSQKEQTVATEEKKQETEVEKSDKEATEVLEVSVWSHDGSIDSVLSPLIEEFNATTGKEEGIEINYLLSGDMKTMLELAHENNELPLLANNKGGTTYEEGGMMVPISYLPGGQEFIDEWGKKTGGYSQTNKISGCDEIYSPSYTVTGAAVYYNKEMFVEAGIVDENGEAKAPESWSELLEYAKILTTGNTYGLALQLGWGSCTDYAVIRNAFNYTEEMPFTFDWDNQEVTVNCSEPLETVAKIYQNGYCVPGAESIDNDMARGYFAEGIAGMYFGYSWDIGVYTTNYTTDFEWGVSWLKADDGTDHGMMLASSGFINPTAAVMELSEEDQEKVMTVIKWFYSEEVGVPLTEAGLIFPANSEFAEKADKSNLLPQVVDYMDAMSKGRYTNIPSSFLGKVLVGDANGTKYLNDSVVALCKGEKTLDETVNAINEVFTASFKEQIAGGSLNPEDWK